MEKTSKEKNKKVNPKQKLIGSGSVNYPVGDFLVRLKNASLAGHKDLMVRKTSMIKRVCELLKKEGFVDDVFEKDEYLLLTLSYKNKKPVLKDVKLISKPGVRIYMKKEELEKERGPWTFIVSTSKGIMAAKEAVKKGLGGEVIAKVL